MYRNGEEIRLARTARGLRQKDLAEMVGTYPFAISRIERDDLKPSPVLLDAITRVLDGEVDYMPVAPPRPRIAELADREWLRQKLTVEGLTYQRIADLVGCSRQGVHKRAQQFGLRPRKKPIRLATKRPPKPARKIALKGLLKDKRLRAIYKGKRYIARVFPSGAIKRLDTGQVFDTPSQAARTICSRPVDGWHFWQYKVSQGVWAPLVELKKRSNETHKTPSR